MYLIAASSIVSYSISLLEAPCYVHPSWARLMLFLDGLRLEYEFSPVHRSRSKQALKAFSDIV